MLTVSEVSEDVPGVLFLFPLIFSSSELVPVWDWLSPHISEMASTLLPHRSKSSRLGGAQLQKSLYRSWESFEVPTLDGSLPLRFTPRVDEDSDLSLMLPPGYTEWESEARVGSKEVKSCWQRRRGRYGTENSKEESWYCCIHCIDWNLKSMMTQSVMKCIKCRKIKWSDYSKVAPQRRGRVQGPL